MPDFPTSLYTERTTSNLPGITYDPANEKNLYSEDFQHHAAEIIAIETALGVGMANVASPLGFTAENVANKKTGLSDNSDTFYPSQKAVKTAVDAKQNSLGFTAENVANKATDLTSPDNTKYPTTQAVANALVTAIAGLLNYRGAYDASGNAFPSSGGSGVAGAILKADFWICSVAGTLGGSAVTAGDLIIAKVNTPGTTAGNWDLIEHDLAYVPENVANKATNLSSNDNTHYPTTAAVQAALPTLPVKATGAEVTTGTNDTKFVTPKAMADAGVNVPGGGGGGSASGHYVGNGATNQAIAHGLPSTPKYVRITDFSDTAATEFYIFGSNPTKLASVRGGGYQTQTTMDATNFYVGPYPYGNNSGDDYYWFAVC